jgi:hypothetical protein
MVSFAAAEPIVGRNARHNATKESTVNFHALIVYLLLVFWMITFPSLHPYLR